MSQIEMPTRACSSGVPLMRDQAALALNQHVIGFLLAVRPRLAIAGDRTIDETGIGRGQRRSTEAQPRRCPRSQILDEHIGLGDDIVQHGEIVRRLEIKANQFLAPVQPHEIGALALHQMVIAPCEITLRTLHLDNPGAGIGKLARGIGCGHRLLQRHHQQPLKIPHAVLLSVPAMLESPDEVA